MTKMKMWIYIVIGVLIILLILVFTGRKSVHHEIMIEASPETVWNVLMDMEKYPEWNPVMELVEGEVKEGEKVTYRFSQDEQNSYDIPSQVKSVIPKKLLNQGGGMTMVLTFNHQYILEDSGTATEVIIHEDYRGIGVHFWNPAPVEKAYQRLNEALKARAEKM